MLFEWRNDGRMTGISEFSFFLPLQKQLHFSSFRHSNIIPSFLKWKGMIITMEVISFKSHSSHLNFIPVNLVIRGMPEWWGMEGDFWTKAEALILKISSFNCHSMSLLYSSQGHSFHLKAIPDIWGSFQNWCQSWIILSFINHPKKSLFWCPRNDLGINRNGVGMK